MIYRNLYPKFILKVSEIVYLGGAVTSGEGAPEDPLTYDTNTNSTTTNDNTTTNTNTNTTTTTNNNNENNENNNNNSNAI